MKFKQAIVLIAIFILTIMLIFFINEAINPRPQYSSSSGPIMYDNSDYNTSYQSYDNKIKDYNLLSFVIVLTLSALAIAGGALVRKVPPVSGGLMGAGVVSILYVMTTGFEDIDKPIRAAVTGIALGLLLWLAYKAFPPEPHEPKPGANAFANSAPNAEIKS